MDHSSLLAAGRATPDILTVLGVPPWSPGCWTSPLLGHRRHLGHRMEPTHRRPPIPALHRGLVVGATRLARRAAHPAPVAQPLRRRNRAGLRTLRPGARGLVDAGLRRLGYGEHPPVLRLRPGRGAAGRRRRVPRHRRGATRADPPQHHTAAGPGWSGRYLRLAIPGLVWTRGQVRDLVKRWFGVELSLVAIGKYLRPWGLSPQKPVRRPTSRTPRRSPGDWRSTTLPSPTRPPGNTRSSSGWTRPDCAPTPPLAPPGRRSTRHR